MKASLFASILFATAILPSCAYDEGKGEEDNALDQYDEKADSFRKPTEHGTLLFGVPQSARITEDAGFHAWDFTLGDDANVSLATLLVTDNLDTVMYLYKYDDMAASYGRYLFKNDDADDTTVASALKKSLDAGTYRVIVKGFKAQLSGSFQMSANCDGAGCAVSSCDTATFEGLASDNGDSCGELFSDALSGRFRDRNDTTVTLDERCSLPESVAGAIEDYVAYFGGVDEFNDSFNYGSPGDPVEIEVSWDTYDTGATYVQVDAGGDEAAMDYLVNGDGQVIAHYQHNQSPDHTLYCDGGDEYLDDGECFFEYVANFPHAAADERNVIATVTSSTASSQPEKAISVAVQAYAAELGLSSNVTINVDATLWDLGGQDSAGRVRVKASGERTFVYELSAHANTQFQFSVKRGNRNKAYDCKEL